MIGKTLLHYEIKDQLGKGGMGEVFSARDTKLRRDVAIKILPADLSGDPEREFRFQREARALASLQHANVATVYGFEEVGGIRFLVMELVVGAELTRRLKQGPVPVAEALGIARQIAAGLEAAHEKGIVHRDLNPANIMESEAGEIKILDFGLAQAWFGDSDSKQVSDTSPTMTAVPTQVGAILGTAAYMSPEQARGSVVDCRADIWAFGVILFEMLTGKQLFHGKTTSDTLAAVLRAEPDWDSLPVAEAPELCRLVERCLERNPRQRLRDIGDARIFLQGAGTSGSHLGFSHVGLTASTGEHAATRFPALLLVGLAVACLAAGAAIGWKLMARPAPGPVLHAMIPPPANTDYDLRAGDPGPAVISPDGTMVAFSAMGEDGVGLLYLQHLDQGESFGLSGTEQAAYPFWSPDSRFIAFFENGGKLKKVAVGGGPPVTLCAALNGKGGSWSDRGDIIFAPTADSGIFKVSANGGEPVRLTTPGPEHNSHRHPRFLPGGRRYLFIGRPLSSAAANCVYLASLDTAVAPRVIGESEAQAEYADGYLLTVREDVLMATPFAPDQEKVVDGGVPLVNNVFSVPRAEVGVFSTSSRGMMVFQTGTSNRTEQQLYWSTIEGDVQEPLGELGKVYHPEISPDGKRAVVEVGNESHEGTDLWLVDLQTGLRSRFTFAPGDEKRPCWSPGGSFVYYESQREGVFHIMRQAVDGQGNPAILLEAEREIAATSVSAGDQALLFDCERADGKFEMRLLPLAAAGGEEVTIATAPKANLGGGVYSPDGRWIAYHTESAAGWDVFVIPAAGGPRMWQVTTSGALYPKWSHDGRQLWVSDFNGDLRIYDVDGTGQTFSIGSFRKSLKVAPPDATGSYYSLHPDGLRILQSGVDPSFRAEVSYLHLITDWRRGLVQ